MSSSWPREDQCGALVTIPVVPILDSSSSVSTPVVPILSYESDSPIESFCFWYMFISGDNIWQYASRWLELAISKNVFDIEIALLIVLLQILENFQDITKLHQCQSACSAVVDASQNGHKKRNFVDMHDIHCQCHFLVVIPNMFRYWDDVRLHSQLVSPHGLAFQSGDTWSEDFVHEMDVPWDLGQ